MDEITMAYLQEDREDDEGAIIGPADISCSYRWRWRASSVVRSLKELLCIGLHPLLQLLGPDKVSATYRLKSVGLDHVFEFINNLLVWQTTRSGHHRR